jgi:hypothetical protein
MQSNAVATQLGSVDRQPACCAVKKAKTFFSVSRSWPTERDALIRMGLLSKAQRNDKKAVRDALYEFFENHRGPRNATAFAGERMSGRVLINPA